MAEERNLLDHLGVVVRWRRMILTSFVTITLTTTGISMILPEAYQGRAVVYPPKESSDVLGGLSSLLADLPVNLLGLSGASVSATDFVPVLKSARVADAVATRFDLATQYETETREQLLMEIEGRLDVELSREQFLSVSYEAETPELAAEMTNAFVEELDRALRDRKTQQVRALREYFELRLSEAEHDVARTELAYKSFQSEHMAIDIETQAKSQIETAGNVMSQLAELIIGRDVAKRMMEPNHPKLKQLDLEVDATRNAIDRMLMGTNGLEPEEIATDLPDIIIPFREIPELGLKMLQHLRDIKIQNAIYTFVRQEYEKARLEEDKESALVIPLDLAKPPDSRSRPRRTLMVSIAGGLSLVFATLLAFLFEALRNLDDKSRQKLDAIVGEFRPRR